MIEENLNGVIDEDNEKELRKLLSENAEAISLEQIISLLPGSIYWKDINGRYLGCNQDTLRMSNLSSPSEFIGKRLTDMFPKEIAKRVEAIDQEVMRSNTPLRCEEQGLNEKRESAIFFSHKLPLHNKTGEVIGLLGASFDITDRKKMEEELKIAKEKAEASNLAKSQFLAVMNHELRTPIASIVGLLNFLKRGTLSQEEQHDIVTNMENCTKHLLTLVDDVLDFSRLDTGNYTPRISSVNIANLLYEIYNMLKPLAENKGLDFDLETNNLHLNVFTDARILRQILINLLNNAIKFTDKGYVRLQLNQTARNGTKHQLKISITDTGPGIPADKLELIFEPFQQLEDAYTRQSSRSGTGLGLAIVKKLAALLSTNIQAHSQVFEGSTFILEGEFEQDTSPGKAIRASKSPQNHIIVKTIYPHPLKTKPLVLLVEDDPIVQFIHQKMLLELGCEVEIVASGLEAIKRFADQHILFVDISLPDCNGFDVIKAVRTTKHGKDVPIIALTVYNAKEERAACLNAGADEFQNKPISESGLRRTLLKYLR